MVVLRNYNKGFYKDVSTLSDVCKTSPIMGDLVIKLYWEHVNHRLHVCSAVSPPASRYRARNIKQSAQKMIVFSTNFLFPPSLSVPRSRAGPRLPLPASLQSSRPSPRYKYFWNLKIFFLIFPCEPKHKTTLYAMESWETSLRNLCFWLN